MSGQFGARLGQFPMRAISTLTVGKLGRALTPFILTFLLLQVPAVAQSPDEEGAANPPGPFSAESFQTDLFTGAASAAVPIVVPPGTGGAGPKIVLRYNSGTVDDLDPRQQGQWAGLGWTLDVGGFILRNTKNTATTSDDTFRLVFGGVSHDLVLVDSGHNIYHTKDETFWHLQYDAGTDAWTLKNKNGTAHRFGYNSDSKAVTYAPSSPYTSQSAPVTYKYLLDQVKTTRGISVTYAYWKQSGTTTDGRTYTQAVYPDTITYSYRDDSLVGPARTVQFLRADRKDYPTPTTALAFFEQYRLASIEVRVGGSLVRRYAFGYDEDYTLIDRDTTYTWDGSGTSVNGDLALRSVTQIGSNGTFALPPLTFDYLGAYLQAIHNGIGGTVSYTYDRVTYTAAPLYSVLKQTTGSNCLDRGVWDGPGLAQCSSQAMVLGYLLPPNLPGIVPIYHVCKKVDSITGLCLDFGADDAPGVGGGTWQPKLLGYAFTTSYQGTTPIYSTCLTLSFPYCLDWGANRTFVDPGGSLSPKHLGYIFLGKFDRSRVITRTASDGRNPPATTTFAYQDPALSTDGREFRGHAWVRATDPAGHYSDTWFYQDEALKGRAYQVDPHASPSAGGALYTRMVNLWTPSTPYTGTTFARLDRTDVYTYDGGSNFKQTRRAFQYDNYGNITVVQSFGDLDDTGDERTDITEYEVNTTDYIVGLPSQSSTLDAEGVVVAHTWFYYDDATNHAGAPTMGKLTARCRWLNGGTGPCELFGYDEYGNVTTTTSPEGYRTTIVYDAIYHTFPATVTTPGTPNVQKGLITEYVYDHRYGTVSTVTDPNGQSTTYTTDVFGRPETVTSALQETRTTRYQNFGTMGSQNVRTEFPGGLWTEVYFDGLGRTFQVKKKAANGQVSVEGTSFDARGLVQQKCLPGFGVPSSACSTYQYDPLGRLTLTTFPDTSTERLAYNDWTIILTDRNGHSRTTVKDAYSRTLQVTEPGGAITRYAYDALGRLERVTDAAGHVTTMVYDTLGRKVQMTEPNMGTWSYGYDLNGNLISQTDAKGQTLRFSYDGLNRLATKTYPGTPTGTPPTITGGTVNPPTGQGGIESTFTVTASGGTLPDGTSPTGYEARWGIFDGAAWSIRKPWNADLMFQWTPPANPNPAYVVAVEVRGKSTSGRTPATIYPVAYPVGGSGAPAPGISAITANPPTVDVGHPVEFSVQGSGGIPPDYAYETRWDLSANGGTTWTTVRPWATDLRFTWTPTDGNTYIIRAYIRNAGAAGDTPSSFTDLQYTVGASQPAPTIPLNGLTADKTSPQPAGTTIVFTVTASGGIEPYETRWGTSTDGINWTIVRDWAEGTHFAWTPTEPSSPQNRVGVQIRNAGTPGDAPSSLTDTAFVIGSAFQPPHVDPPSVPSGSQPVGTPITFTVFPTEGTPPYSSHWGVYDGATWTILRPWAGNTSFTWTPTVANPAYQIAVEVRSNGSLLAALAISAPFAITGPGGGTTVTYTYDTGYGKGRRTGMNDLAGQELYAYDALGRRTSVTRTIDTASYTTQTTYKFPSVGLIDKFTYPDGEQVTYDYNDAGQVTSVVGATTYVSNITYKASGQVEAIAYGNGVTATHTYELTTLRLQTLQTTGPGGTLQNLQYGYDAVGNVKTITDPQNAAVRQEFDYDDLNRLTSARRPNATPPYTPSYTYDTLGNLTSNAGVTYTYNTYQTPYETCGRPMPHAVATFTSPSDVKRYSYDCNGNMVAEVSPTGVERTFVWDADNKPVAITRDGAATTFLYSGDGVRVKKVGLTKTIRYVGSFEDQVTDGIQSKHIFVGGLRVATRVNSGGDAGTYFPHGDHLGSLNVLTNSSGGEVQRLAYLPFGETYLPGSGGDPDVDWRQFTGQELDPETGLYFYQARYYNPVLGRFLSPDPMVPEPGNPQSLNRYSYVVNNPLNLVDPSGLMGEFPSEFPTDLGVPFTDFPSIPLDFRIRPPDTDAGVPPGVGDLDIRAWAAARLLIRAGEIGTGVLVGGMWGWTGIGAIGAVSMVGHGILGASADIETLVFGEPTSSVPSQILQNLGVPQSTADALDVGLSGGAALSGAAAALLPTEVALTGGVAAGGAASSAVQFDWARAQHVFSNAIGHVSPTTAASQQRFARIFEVVASNPNNLRVDFSLPKDALNAGVQVFTQVFRNGQQIWVYVRNGQIINAGINIPGVHR